MSRYATLVVIEKPDLKNKYEFKMTSPTIDTPLFYSAKEVDIGNARFLALEFCRLSGINGYNIATSMYIGIITDKMVFVVIDGKEI